MKIKGLPFKQRFEVYEGVYVQPKGEKLRACAVALVTPDGQGGIGTAVCSPDDTFSVKEGLRLARGRAYEQLVAKKSHWLMIDPNDPKGYVSEIARMAAEEHVEQVKKRKIERLEKKQRKWLERAQRELWRNGIESTIFVAENGMVDLKLS